jgi:hypothetical protein
MNEIGIALWRELLSQFLLTFGLLSSIGFGVWVVGAGCSYLRRPRSRPCPTQLDAPPHGHHSPPGTVDHSLVLYRRGGEARGRLGTAKARARARAGHI